MSATAWHTMGASFDLLCAFPRFFPQDATRPAPKPLALPPSSQEARIARTRAAPSSASQLCSATNTRSRMRCHHQLPRLRSRIAAAWVAMQSPAQTASQLARPRQVVLQAAVPLLPSSQRPCQHLQPLQHQETVLPQSSPEAPSTWRQLTAREASTATDVLLHNARL